MRSPSRWTRWTAEFWDERYRSAPALWSGNANAVVMAETGRPARGPGARHRRLAAWPRTRARRRVRRGRRRPVARRARLAGRRGRRLAGRARPRARGGRGRGMHGSGHLDAAGRAVVDSRRPRRTTWCTVSFLHFAVHHQAARVRRPRRGGRARGFLPRGRAPPARPRGGPSAAGARPVLHAGGLVAETRRGMGRRHATRPEPGRAKHPDGYEVTLHDTVLRATRATR